MTVAKLSERVRRDLTYLSYPSRAWTIKHTHDGAPVLDVLIVGGGQGGLATAFGLKRERVDNVRIVDRNPRGLEGPWRRFARMRQLRTPKDVTGIDFGIPSLTAQAWYEAKFGSRAWKSIAAIAPDVWRDYLDWYRDVLALPVENNTEVTSIEPAGDLLLAHLRRRGRSERVLARKIVLATGIDGSGGWRAPPALVADLPRERWAHSSDKIDFRRLRGKRIGVLGAGANAFDNAAAALEAGAARVDLCVRRAELPRVNPLIWTNFSGMLGHFAELGDLQRWRFMRYILEKPPMPPPQEAFWRCRKFGNFAWHTSCGWHAVRWDGKVATVEADGVRSFAFDFIIFATGFETDLSAWPELAPIVRHIALWRDKFTPPAGEESDLVARHPYLGPTFEFTERESGRAPYLRRAAPIVTDAVARPTALYQVPDLTTVDLSWAGRLKTGHRSLAAISAAKVGDPVHVLRDGPSWMMQDKQGQTLGRMARSWSPPEDLSFLRGEVGAIVRWRKSDNQEEYRVHLHRDVWEAVLPELVFG